MFWCKVSIVYLPVPLDYPVLEYCQKIFLSIVFIIFFSWFRKDIFGKKISPKSKKYPKINVWLRAEKILCLKWYA
jgi:hypothetical protein